MASPATAAHAADPFGPILVCTRCAGFIATLLAALMTTSFGAAMGESLVGMIALGGLFGLASFIVGYGLVFARRFYYEGNRPFMGLSVAIFAVAVIVEFASHFGFVAAHRQATTDTASMQTVAYKDAHKAIDEARTNVDRIQEALKMRPARTEAAAQSEIDRSKAHRFWHLTGECKTTRGPETRAFCAGYFAAVADVGGHRERAKLEGELAAAESKLADARGKASGVKMSSAAATSQATVLASIGTLSTAPSADAQFWTNVALAGLAALFCVMIGCLNMLASAFDSNRLRAPGAPVFAAANDQPPRAMIGDTHALKTLAGLISAAPPARAAA